MKEERRKKAESISKKIIREHLVETLKELSQEFGIVSITDVKISNDLSYMDVFASSIKNQKSLTKSLAPHAITLQRILWKKIDFIKVPKIRFRSDESLELSSRIHNTIKEIHS